MNTPEKPHYVIASSDLATWIENQGADQWWSVDGDPVLTGRLSFPCPGDELASELRRSKRQLFVFDPRENPQGTGERIGLDELDALVTRLGDNVQFKGEKPLWASDRQLFLCWDGADLVWLLEEDGETAQRSRADAEAVALGKN